MAESNEKQLKQNKNEECRILAVEPKLAVKFPISSVVFQWFGFHAVCISASPYIQKWTGVRESAGKNQWYFQRNLFESVNELKWELHLSDFTHTKLHTIFYSTDVLINNETVILFGLKRLQCTANSVSPKGNHQAKETLGLRQSITSYLK